METKLNRLEPVQDQIVSRKVYRLFEEYARYPFIFVNHAGNHGDTLIYMGAEKLARRAGLQYQSLTHEEFMAAKIDHETVIYIQGGGSFNALWCGDVMEELARAATIEKAIVIVGPQTFFMEKDFLSQSIVDPLKNHRARKVFIFTRGAVSYRSLKEVLPASIELELDHDTALNMTVADLEPISPAKKYRYYAIREDKEKKEFRKQSLFWVWNDPIHAAQDFQHWLLLHAQAEEIITNRLHSAILGSILGKSVTLLPNSYYKNRAVWEYSLQSRGVKWAENIEESSTYHLLKRTKIYDKFLNSYKVNQVVQHWLMNFK